MMLRLGTRELAAHKRRFVSTVLAVLLGVAFLSGTLVLTDTIGRTLDGVLADGARGTDAYVRTPAALTVGFGQPRPRLAADLAERAAAVPGAAAATPMISGYAQLVDRSGRPVGDQEQGAPLFGENWVSSPTLNPYRLAEGRAPQADDEIVVDRGTARAAGFHPGDRATVLTKADPATFTIVGIARFGSADSMAGAHAVLFTTAAAQRYVAEPGRADGIAVAARSGVSQDELADQLRTALSADGVEVMTGRAWTAENQDAVREGLAGFDVFMLIFAGVALFVGAFIINNTFSIIVAQRSREVALLRAIGASRRQVLVSVLAESTLIGAVASAAGLGCGVLVARGLQSLLSQFGLDVPAGAPVIETRTVVVSLTVGLVVTVASALIPARRASRVAPVAALRDAAAETTGTSRRRAVVGAVVTGAGVAALLDGLSGAGSALVGLGAAVVFVGVSVLGPVIVGPVVRLVGAPLPRLRGVSGHLARQNALRNPKRTARTAAALMIGVGLVGFITIFAASTKASVADSIRTDFRGDHVVDSGSFDGSAGLSPDLAAALRTAPGVRAVSETRATTAKVDGTLIQQLNAWEPATIGQLFDLGRVTGSVPDLGADGLAVASGYAADHRWAVGDRVPVTFSDGERTFTVRAIFDRSDEWLGKVWVAIDAVPTELDSRVYVAADDGSVVSRIASAYPAASVLDKAGLTKDVEADIDQILGLIYVLLALAVVIALLGIANTLALSIHERTRELGLLRAVGMTRAQLRAAVRWESVLIALFGTVLGLGVGSFFGWAMVRALAGEGIDRLVLPAGALATVAAIAALAGVAAALPPARRASRLHVLDAVQAS